MKIKTILSLLLMMSIFMQGEAQIWKKVKNAAQRGVERTVENRTQREASNATDDAIDTALGKKKTKSSNQQNNSKSSNEQPKTGSLEDDAQLSEIGDNQVGFKTGKTIIYSDNFMKDAIGDFPAKWNSSLGGEVKKLKGMNENWLKVPAGSVVNLEMTKPLPPNFTAEMDLIIPNDIEYKIVGIGFSETTRSFDYTLSPKDGFAVMFYAKDDIPDFRFGNREINLRWTQKAYDFPFNKKIHLAFEVNNHERVRVYLDGKKVVDLPRIFRPEYANNFIINAMTHGAGGSKLNYFYVSNVVIAETGTDERSNVMKELLEKGSFSTNEILFASGSDKLEPSSSKIIDEVAKVILSAPGDWHMTIIGHTDSDGDAKSNEKLSLDRADAVKKYLVSNYDIKGKSLNVVGKGESEPIADNSTAAGKAQNRRVEFRKK